MSRVEKFRLGGAPGTRGLTARANPLAGPGAGENLTAHEALAHFGLVRFVGFGLQMVFVLLAHFPSLDIAVQHIQSLI